MALEQEIKMVVNSEQRLDISLLDTVQPLQIKDKKVSHLRNIYFDTPDLRLKQQKLGLRMRQSDDSWLQTVKTSGMVKDGFHQRDEWEYPLARPEWDSEALKQTPLRAMIEQDNLLDKIVPLFTTDFIRESNQIILEDGTELDLAYDDGEVSAKDKKQRIHEIELELKSGNIESLRALAQQLAQCFPLSPNNTSKAQMGYQLLKQAEA